MKTGPKVVLIALCLLCSTVSAFCQTLGLERRLFILSKTYASIPIQFAHWRDASYKPEKTDSVYFKFLRRAVGTEDRKQFAFLMEEYIALLNNGHSWYIDRKMRDAVLPMGFSFRPLGAEWVVDNSSVSQIHPGDIVLKLNGKTLADHYSAVRKYISASTERARRLKFLQTLAAVEPDTCTLEVMTAQAKDTQVTIERRSLHTAAAPEKTVARWIEPGEIGYLKIPSFNSQEFENDALDELRDYMKSQAIIVDVRGNGGGSTPSRLIEALMNRPYRGWTVSTPLILSLFRYYTIAFPSLELNDYFRNAQVMWPSEQSQPDPKAYSGTLIILVDAVTGSAAEDFCIPFKDNGRALIIGDTTNGSTGQPFMYDFGDGINIGIGTKRAYMPNGAEFEGLGIFPDIQIPVLREDLYSGTDRVLDRAVGEAKRLASRR